MANTAAGAVNNPGNIRAEKYPYPGVIYDATKPFLSFDTLANGYNAMVVKYKYYYDNFGDKTLNAIINRYAPPADNNDTDTYVKSVSEAIGCDPDADFGDILNNNDTMAAMLKAVTVVEQGDAFVTQNSDDIDAAISSLFSENS